MLSQSVGLQSTKHKFETFHSTRPCYVDRPIRWRLSVRSEFLHIHIYTNVRTLFFFSTFFLQVSLTANVILRRPVLGRGGKKNIYMYSVYYGQTFDSEGSSENQKTALTSTYYMRDLGDVTRFPALINTEEIINQFGLLFDDSESSIHDLINYVILFRRTTRRPMVRTSKKGKNQKTYSISI